MFVHTQRSHTLSGTVLHGEKAWGKRWISWTQVCRRFTRVNVTKQTAQLHHEIYLTPSLESAQQAWTKVRLMLLSPSTMKYLPDDNLLLSLVKQWQQHQQIWPVLSKPGHTTVRSVNWPGRCQSLGVFYNNDCAKVADNVLIFALGSWPPRPSYNDGHGLDLWNSNTSRQKHRCRDPLLHD